MTGPSISVQRKLPAITSRLFLLGFLGILANIPLVIRLVKSQSEALGIPLASVVIVSTVQSSVFLLIAIIVGQILSQRVGLRSHIANSFARKSFTRELPLALSLGLASALLAFGIEAFFSLFIATELEQLNQAIPRGFVTTLAGVLYGGITEELLMRWGLLSFVVWAVWKLFYRKQAKPDQKVFWLSIVLVAVLFGVGHLAAVAALTELTTLLAIRTVLLNALVAIIFGWLFWKRSLEAAMTTHMTWHLVVTLLSLALPLA